MKFPPDSEEMVNAILSGRRLELARILTEVENRTPAGQAALDRLFIFAGKAHIIGVTGAPGTGKSSLVNQLAHTWRRIYPDQKIAIVAIDPTSPFTGGAVLGDRVRMRDLAGDNGVFIRSMASRGALGGLAPTTSALVQVFDAAGYDPIFIETVGAGQSEVDIARLAHTTLVVETPGLGDDVQAIKAGILEIADILIVNKADQPGADAAVRTLRMMVEMGIHNGTGIDNGHHQTASMGNIENPTPSAETGWIPPVLATISTQPDGIDHLVSVIQDHHAYLHGSGEWQSRDRDRLSADLIYLLQSELISRWRAENPPGILENAVVELQQRKTTPRQMLERLLSSS